MVPHLSTQLAEEKRALRSKMSARRDAVPAGEPLARGAAAAERLLGLPEAARVLRGGVVAGYVAFRNEIDPAPALAAARAAGAVVALPRVAEGTPRLRFHRADAGASLRSGPWGLLEPDAAAPEIALGAI